MKNVQQYFPRLMPVVRDAHLAYDMEKTGHSFDHALQVSQCGMIIAENEDIMRLAGASGLCHNADRMLQRAFGVGKADVPEDVVTELIDDWLKKSGELNSEDAARLKRAVLLHSGPNRDDGDELLVALQDADRIVCSMADAVMGATQFWAELRTIDPEWLDTDPTAHSYRNPKSVLRNLECRYDWVDPSSPFCVRLPRAKALMERRVTYIRNFITEVREQRAEIGLWPYPVKW